MFTNGVEIDPNLKDAWGIPTVRLTGKRHPADLETGRFLAERAAQWLKEAGALATFVKLPGKGTDGGQHQAGTCRMGTDPKTSVTNQFGRLHETPNAFVMDGSVHVNNGGFNPSLTIQALAFRSAGQLLRDWRGGGLR